MSDTPERRNTCSKWRRVIVDFYSIMKASPYPQAYFPVLTAATLSFYAVSPHTCCIDSDINVQTLDLWLLCHFTCSVLKLHLEAQPQLISYSYTTHFTADLIKISIKIPTTLFKLLINRLDHIWWIERRILAAIKLTWLPKLSSRGQCQCVCSPRSHAGPLTLLFLQSLLWFLSLQFPSWGVY